MKLMFQTVVVRSHASLAKTETATVGAQTIQPLPDYEPSQPLSIVVSPLEEAKLRSPSLSPTGTIRFDSIMN
jgi:hypothetical protein